MKEVFVRLEQCLACRSCQLACAVEHSKSKTLLAAIHETPTPRYRLYLARSGNRTVPLTCRHCDPSPCLDACIAGALYRDAEGRVLQSSERCTGCWTCLMVCPYGVVGRRAEAKTAVKCDLCPDRIQPACVEACPTQALVFTEPEAFARRVRQDAAGAVAQANPSAQNA